MSRFRLGIQHLKRTVLWITALAAGLFLFTGMAAWHTDSSLLTYETHHRLIASQGVYRHVADVVHKSIEEYFNGLKTPGQKEAEMQKQLVELVEKAATPQMIQLNIDSIVEGLFRYFRDETRFLPDLYLRPVKGSTAESEQTPTEKNDAVSKESLQGIDKINLSVILLYLERSDISNHLSFIRLARYMTANLFPPLFLLALVLFVLAWVISRKLVEMRKWLGMALLSAATLSLSTAVLLMAGSFIVLPRYTGLLAMSIPLPEQVILQYIQAFMLPQSGFFAAAGVSMLILSALGRMIPSVFPVKLPSPRIMQISGFSLLAFVLLLTCIKINLISKDFQSKDYPVILQKMKGVSMVTRIIPAKDEIIYSLSVQVMDKASSLPIPGVFVNVSGRTDKEARALSMSKLSDETGTAKYMLDQGTFKMNFDHASFPEGYKIPSPIIFEMRTAGTTVMTVGLERVESPLPGIAEIEILGRDHQPVQGIQMILQKSVPANRTPAEPPQNLSRVYSLTNQDGIGVFKVEEGDYSVLLKESTLPEGYLPSPHFELTLQAGFTHRVTLQLADKPKPSPPPKPSPKPFKKKRK